MKFYTVLKYVLGVVFLIVMGIAILQTESDQPKQQPQVQSGPKFNF